VAIGEKREAGWEELFATIWETAVRNDYEEAVKRLTDYAYRKAYDEYSIEVVKPLPQNSKELRAVKKAIREQAKLLCERLMPRIRQLVYAESQEWPNNRYKTTKDPEYKEMFNELKKEAVVFAVDK
jgi:ribonuclease D